VLAMIQPFHGSILTKAYWNRERKKLVYDIFAWVGSFWDFSASHEDVLFYSLRMKPLVLLGLHSIFDTTFAFTILHIPPAAPPLSSMMLICLCVPIATSRAGGKSRMGPA